MIVRRRTPVRVRLFFYPGRHASFWLHLDIIPAGLLRGWNCLKGFGESATVQIVLPCFSADRGDTAGASCRVLVEPGPPFQLGDGELVQHQYACPRRAQQAGDGPYLFRAHRALEGRVRHP